MRRQVNVFVATAQPDLVKKVETGIALEGIPTRCFARQSSGNLRGADYRVRKAVESALVDACDVTVVVGEELTPDVVMSVEEALEKEKPVCVCRGLKDALRREIEAKYQASRFDFEEDLLDVVREIQQN